MVEAGNSIMTLQNKLYPHILIISVSCFLKWPDHGETASDAPDCYTVLIVHVHVSLL